MLRMPSHGSTVGTGASEKRAFARVLIQLRKERGLSQEALASKSGYHAKYISLLERAKYSPSLTTIIEIAEALGVSGSNLVLRVEKLLPKNRRRRRDSRDIR